MAKKNPLSQLWIGRAIIFDETQILDPETGETTAYTSPLSFKPEPCRLSHLRETTVTSENGAPMIGQSIVLFLRPEVDIKPGCRIRVVQHGYDNWYVAASKPSKYTNHQEVTLRLADDTA